MSRTRSPQYNDQCEKILTIAAALFAHKGYQATTMNDVAQACAFSKPALYHYMRDKYALLTHICENHVARLETLIDQVMQQHLSPQDHIRALIMCFVEAYADAQHAHRVLIAEAKFLNHSDQTRILDSERRIVSAFAQAVVTLHPELAKRQITKPLTMLLFGMINWMFTWLKPNRALTYQTMAPLVADFFLGGLHALCIDASQHNNEAQPATKLNSTVFRSHA
ncbi:MAG: TetR family transcriptional regulator [Ottowia sp.]|nr:TetR family transcriptional regulator [Ottowia sp.]